MHWLPREEGGTFKMSTATISHGLIVVAMIGGMGTGLGSITQWLQYCDTSLAMPTQ